MLNEKELEIYYDHYKDTFFWLRKYLNLRDRYFAYLVFLVVALYFNSFLPSDFERVAKSFLKSNIGVDDYSNFLLVDSAVLFLIFSVSIRYFQINLVIERQYPYLHHIEKKLSKNLKHFKIFREGKGYLSNYPLFSSVIHWVYTMIFPVLLIILVAIKWCLIANSNINPGFIGFDSIICFLIILLTLLYMSWIHFKDFRKCKKG